MTKTFQIGDFLTVEGDGLTLNLNGAHQDVSGFSRLTLKDAATVVEFEAEARSSVPPVGGAIGVAESILHFDADDVSPGGSNNRIELKSNRNAFLSFHWPNPLTPHGSGLWIRLAIVRVNDEYQLSFINNPPLLNRGFGFYFQNQDWQRFLLNGPEQTVSLTKWKDFRLADSDIPGVDSSALAASPPLNGSESALIDNASSRSWTFQWRFLPKGLDNNRAVFRPVAMVQDGQPGKDAKEVAVNSRVLRLEENPDIQSRPLVWRRTLQLSCASLPTGTAAEPGAWYVDWSSVPTLDPMAGLSLRGFWQAVARHWALGLRSLRSRNSLTFLPTDIRAGDPALAPLHAGDSPPWTFRFRVDRGTAPWRSRLERVGSFLRVPLRFDLASALDVTGRPSGFDTLVESDKFQALAALSEPSKSFFNFLLGPSQQPLGDLLVGGIRLALGKLVDGPQGDTETRSQLSVAFADSPISLGQPPVAVTLQLNAAGGLPQPASEDPERGFETENDLLNRERPLVIDLSPKSSLTALTVRETADAVSSRVLTLTVRAGSQAVVLDSDVVVIDPGPFLLVRVLATTEKVEPRQILAVYQDDGENPAGWELLTDTGAMTLVLPPQAIGEEMIKGILSITDKDGAQHGVPLTDVPFDYRLSPPAHLTLDRTDVDTARTAAPWTLRRLLDRRDGVTGLKLDGADFELLYGLTAKLDGAQGLRVAEQDAFVGRVPLAPALRDLLPGQTAAEIPADLGTYASSVIGWIRGLMARPAQLPVFRDLAARERLTLSDGLSLELRESRQTANPLAVDRYHPPIQDTDKVTDWDTQEVVPPGLDGGRKPLRGGVDYPFESRNIYGAVLDQDRAKTGAKGEAQARIAGLVFGALGGSGSQQATFDEGRTLIISETAQGRLSSLTLVRVGRISMLWHHARHVIVYERTTRTMPRYDKLQPKGFEGLAAMRKVREYIEIMQPRRGYPDFGDASASSDGPPLAGPIAGGFFETTVIPVKPDWGHDIDGGWVTALRGPFSDDTEAPFYPFPKIFLELARAAGKGEGAINHQLADPSQLLFFTTTKQGLGGDSDAWPPWPDIDLPLTQRPQPPQVPFLPSFSGTSHQPDAADHDYGQRRFTLDVVPPEEAANLMHGRPGAGLEARVRNVSLLRGRVPNNVRSTVDDTVGKVFAQSEARINDGLAELAQHLERLVQEGAGKTVGEIAGLREQALDLLQHAHDDASTLQGKVGEAEALIKGKVEDWSQILERRQKDAKAELDKALTTAGGYKDQLLGALDGVVKRLQTGVPSAELTEEAKARLANALDSVCQQARQRLESTPFLPAEALGLLQAELDRDKTDLKSFVAGLSQDLTAFVEQMAERYAVADPTALRRDLIAALQAARARVVALGADFSRQVKARLGPLFGDLPIENGAVGQLTKVIDQAVTFLIGKIDDAIRNLPDFKAQPDWVQIKNTITAIQFDTDALFQGVSNHLVTPLNDKVQEWRKNVSDAITSFQDTCTAKVKELSDALDLGVTNLANAVSGVVDGWAQQVQDHASALAIAATQKFGELDAQIKVLQGTLASRADAVQQHVVGVVDALKTSIGDATTDLRALSDKAQDAVRQAGVGLRRVGEDVESAVITELRDQVQSVESASLELARAVAEGPVTDTLRCTRDWVGYYYDAAKDALDVTRSGGVFNNLGSGVLNSLSAQVPFDRIRDRLLPQLADFDLNKLFPDFAGLKLENLLGGLKIPSDPLAEYDWIKVRHGFDRDRLTAWSEVVIDKRFDSDPELFTLPPVALLVEQPRFTARSRIEASQTGVQAQQTEAQLVADWTVTLNGEPIMTIAGGGLYYDGGNGFRFDFQAQNLRLAAVLQFVTDAFKGLLPSDQGLTLTPLFPGGISVELSLPLPDIGTGAFTMTGITLYTHFDLLVAGGFEIRTGLWLSRPERPFGLAVLFLGGGGWFGVDVRYKPPQFETRVSVGVSAGAFVTLNFGVARGSAGILFTAGLDFYRDWQQGGGQDLAISIGLLVWGEFNILAIVSAYLRMVLRVEYRNGAMTGYGQISLSIKICWCFTLRVEESIRLPFASQGGSGAR
ncbi:MAG TPA: hypothetical protein VIE43_17675, partial [Thermoanaerobaculia bacterium]|nr:hypothetical protein [Thermoanaerobaculia bacterium]